ncbi:MAG: RagB/SusD family nutrient uptake outer membrane protein [Gemmatimonadaceae bacterium]
MTSRRITGRRAPAGGHGASRLVAWAALVATLAACSVDSVLRVDTPSRVLPEDLNDPANAQVIVNGVVADFECAFGSYVSVGGTVGEEFHDASIASQWWAYDRRSFGPSGSIYATAGCSNGGIYVPLSTARWQADNALGLLDGWTDEQVPDRVALISRTASYAGYSFILLGEGMCSAAIDGGPELTREQLLTLAEERFTTAITTAEASGVDSLLAFAHAGRARARLDLGRKADAAADARMVPAGFAWNATFTANDPLRENQVYVDNVRSNLLTVDELYRAVAFDGVSDPRVRVEYNPARKGPDQETPLYFQTKYADAGAPIPIARYEEAQLIIAEAEGGTVAIGIINQLHDRAGLPHFDSDDAAEILQQIILERRAEFFLESQHLGDLIRYDLPLTPAAGTPYQRQKGGTYGSQLCFPLPDVERLNNPNIPDA